VNPKVKGFHDHIGQEFAAGLGGDGFGLGTISRLEAKAQMLANPYILHMVQVQGRQSGQYGFSLGIQKASCGMMSISAINRVIGIVR